MFNANSWFSIKYIHENIKRILWIVFTVPEKIESLHQLNTEWMKTILLLYNRKKVMFTLVDGGFHPHPPRKEGALDGVPVVSVHPAQSRWRRGSTAYNLYGRRPGLAAVWRPGGRSCVKHRAGFALWCGIILPQYVTQSSYKVFNLKSHNHLLCLWKEKNIYL